MTAVQPYELKIEALGWNGKMYQTAYENFQVLSELKDYKLIVSNKRCIYVNVYFKDNLNGHVWFMCYIAA